MSSFFSLEIGLGEMNLVFVSQGFGRIVLICYFWCLYYIFKYFFFKEITFFYIIYDKVIFGSWGIEGILVYGIVDFSLKEELVEGISII